MNNKLRFELPFNQLIYSDFRNYKDLRSGDFYILDYIFADFWDGHLNNKKRKQGSAFRGATGSVVRIATDEEIEALVKDYDISELWQQAVEAKTTTESLEDYAEELENTGDLENIVFEEAPESCYQALEEAGIKLKENEKLAYTGGGRCFDASELIKLRNSKEIKIFDPSLYDLIINIEYGLNEMLEEEKARLEIDKSFEKDKRKSENIITALRHIKGLQKALKTS